MHVVSQWKKASTCRSKGAKGEWFEKVYDYALACNSLKRAFIADGGDGTF